MSIGAKLKTRVYESFLRLMPQSEADTLFREILREASILRLESVDDLVIFSDCLAARGGVYRMVASSLEMFAFLNGASRARK